MAAASADSRNPFDDSFEESRGRVTNPFDDTFNEAASNIFSSEDSACMIDDEGTAQREQQQQQQQQQPPSSSSAEASWQYLGNLPYRRIPIYSNVQWERFRSSSSKQHAGVADEDTALWQHGLASFPPSALKHHPKLLEPREVRALLKTSTITHVKGCPHGGPLAVITLPVAAATASAAAERNRHFTRAELRILTNAGNMIAQLELPPPEHQHLYSPADILTLGFTSRTTLVIVLRDSLCLTFNLRGEVLLPPFYILPSNNKNIGGGGGGGGSGLMYARVYDGGVAVLAYDKNSAIVELFDDHDDIEYLQTAHITARKITPHSSAGSGVAVSPSAATASVAAAAAPMQDFDEEFLSSSPPPTHYALVTPLPTAEHASRNMLSFLTLAVLPRSRTISRHPEVFLSTLDKSVVIVETSTLQMTDVDCRARMPSPIVDMNFAPNGRFLACFTESSMLTVISTSFETKVLDFDTSDGTLSPPSEMQWCGEDSVVLHWKNLGVLMVGPYGDWLRFPYEGTENLYIIPEIDCCRVITDTAVEILQRVPKTTAELLRIGSIETAAMLVDAADAFHAGAPTSDETARAILEAGQLDEAIQTCIDAATKEFDIWTQKRLLRAASYGMHFSYKTPEDSTGGTILGGPATLSPEAEENPHLRPSHTAICFVNAARKLRILNALRNPKVGFLATCAQFDAMTPNGVVARLIAMKRPSLACSISAYLGLPKSVQLFARASKAAALVETDNQRSDSEVAEAAMRIINGEDGRSDQARSNPDVSTSINRGAYATVALAANKAGRTGVANLLLMLESSVADKVPALISTGSYADAMAVATSARDADFIFMTLMEYERACMSAISPDDLSKAQSTFLGTVVTKFTPEGFHTLRRYLETMPDIKSVTNLLLRAQRFSSAGAAMAKRALEETDTRERQGMLSEASRIFGLGKETAFHKATTDDYLELLRDQELLRTKYGSPEVAPETSSVTATIASVLKFAATNVREQHRLVNDAEKLGRKYRVPEKRFWHIKVKAYADSEQWSNLRILSESRTRPPIGFKPFARAAIQGKQSSTEILKYIDRLTLPEERYDLFCEAGLWKKAIEEAGRMKDTGRLLNVKTLCQSSEIQLLVDEMLGRLAQ